MPKLIRMYITQVIAGFGLSALFVGALLWFNVANLWHLVSGSDAGVVAAVMLWVFNGIVFAGVQFGIAIMRMGDDDRPAGGKRVAMTPVPVKVAAERPSNVRMFERR
ncbi:hypothetical protein [Tropicibacter naphthalenivorans]|uniref:Uncharacterized protein n=1 Tax=Tropicibacter naphthalenivorans TaxID=441103 RepID=A0A0P1GMI7_9RHOB|nr:hypothetical protein [Tropicibacter naphthalenivorans]CUH75850.1 hypothetical protein TRN7648_00653 [Tropicibacter naphthalenivorans]SMC41861.1 hypothetical protein SAMN04488093_101232 [Tropicibacter naphthalenivorans]